MKQVINIWNRTKLHINKINIFFICIVFIIITPLLLDSYFLHSKFTGSNIVNHSTYFYNCLSIIISIANLYLFYRISVYISGKDDERNRKTIEFQQNQLKLISLLKCKDDIEIQINDLNGAINDYKKKKIDFEKLTEQLENLKSFINTFIQSRSFVLKEGFSIKDIQDNISKTINKELPVTSTGDLISSLNLFVNSFDDDIKRIIGLK